VAAERAVGEPIAILTGNRVVATSAAARVAGVAVGQRRREAQRHCPDVVVLERDLDGEARVFDRVVAVLDDIASQIEIVRPGWCVIPTLGPSRYFGGDPALAELVRTRVGEQLDDPSGCGVGIADGPFTAALAARRSLTRPGAPPLVVAAGSSPDFVAPLPTQVLADPGPLSADLVGVLLRLGLRRLSDVAALQRLDLLDRFGPDGDVAHRLATGQDDRRPRLRDLPADLDRSCELDPPAERVDQVAFAGKALADEFLEGLAAHGLSTLRIGVAFTTTEGVRLERLWRDGGTLGSTGVAQRIRWQIDGWLSRSGARTHGAISKLELRAESVTAAAARQLGLWGGSDARDEHATRGIARLSALVGSEAVCTPEPTGGRGPDVGARLAPAELLTPVSRDPAAPPPVVVGSAAARSAASPWPGSLPAPHPSVVYRAPLSVVVLDRNGTPVGVDGRGLLSAAPKVLVAGAEPPREITAWVGPWLVDERWWDPEFHRRRARFQMVSSQAEHSAAHLLVVEDRRWWVEALYD
jgi:protein ImuB